MTGEEYHTSISQSTFSSNTLGIEIDRPVDIESWFNDMKDGRFIRHGEKDTIVVSAYLWAELMSMMLLLEKE